jgi:hypothetical protein
LQKISTQVCVGDGLTDDALGVGVGSGRGVGRIGGFGLCVLVLAEDGGVTLTVDALTDGEAEAEGEADFECLPAVLGRTEVSGAEPPELVPGAGARSWPPEPGVAPLPEPPERAVSENIVSAAITATAPTL